MTLKNLLTVTAVIAFIFGLGLLLAPAPFMAPNGIQLDASGVLFARSEAAVLVGLALINWFTRQTPDDKVRRGLALGNCVTQLLALGITVTAILSGTLNAAAWVPALLHLVLAGGFGYLLISGRYARQTAVATP